MPYETALQRTKSHATACTPWPHVPTRYEVYTERQLERIPQLRRLPEELVAEMRVVADVLPFRVNRYVTDVLIDWDEAPADPVFQLTFPQRGMLSDEDFERMADVHRRGADRDERRAVADDIRSGLNPHPGDQQALNVPLLDDERVPGLQHKYRETVLFFPSHGQTCHAYCTFCFRWAQFVGDTTLRFSAREAGSLHEYLRRHREVSDLLITGGDPMVMKTRHLADYLTGLLQPSLDHIQHIRIGTKSLTFWPQRYVTDGDADDLLRLFEKIVASGRHLALMAHFNHWREMESPIAREAIRRIRDTGAEIRTQAPLLANINADPAVWSRMWRDQVKLGMIPYYMFVERDTGARRYFEVPLVRAWEIYRAAISGVSGLARTARGPSMSASPGKVEIQGVTEIQGERVLVL